MFEALKTRKEMRKWQKTYNALAPKAGDVAPDFELYDTKRENLIRLSNFRGKKPVALIFGSYT
jgi:hypothetical protein